MESEKEIQETCQAACIRLETSCPNNSCRMWIDYEEDLNCTLITIDKHETLTLREVAEREKLSFVRIQQIEKSALRKLQKKIINKFS